MFNLFHVCFVLFKHVTQCSEMLIICLNVLKNVRDCYKRLISVSDVFFNVRLFFVCSSDQVLSNIWTGNWYKRTISAEQDRLGHPYVRLLPVTIFVDGTNLDKLGRNNATPIIMSLLNFSQEVIAGDASKKLVGFYPDIDLSKEQRQDPAVKEFIRKLNDDVTSSFLEEVAESYTEGGLEFKDTAGITWNLVPVLVFMTTDTKEARAQKGVYESYCCRMPCHICKVLFDDCDVPIAPDDIQYRGGDEATRASSRLAKAASEGDNQSAKDLKEELHAQSLKPWSNPWRLAPMGVILSVIGYFALVWPEVMHQLEGGLMKKALDGVVHLVQRTGVGKW